MISAKEANEMTNIVVKTKIKKWQKKINKWIKRRIKQGYFDAHLTYQDIPNYVYNSLRDYYKKLGYKISINRNPIEYSEYQVVISWKDNEVADE